MRFFAVLMLISSILLVTFSKSIIFLQYELNKNYIASTLCENRTKPKMQCHGSCHLKKTMKSDDQKDDAPGGSVKDDVTSEFFSLPEGDLFFDKGFSKNICSTYIVAAFTAPSFSFFQPPKTA